MSMSTEPIYTLRLVHEGRRLWVLRDEWDSGGNLLGTQQLLESGLWSEYHEPGAEAWSGDPDAPTQKMAFVADMTSSGSWGVPPLPPVRTATQTTATTALTSGDLEVMKQAMEKAAGEHRDALIVSPAVKDILTRGAVEHAIRKEQEFIYRSTQ